MSELYLGFLHLSAGDFSQRFLPLGSSPSIERIVSLTRCLELGGEEAAEQAVGRSEREERPVRDLEAKRLLICDNIRAAFDALTSWALSQEEQHAGFFLVGLLVEVLRESQASNSLIYTDTLRCLHFFAEERVWSYLPSLARILTAMKWMLLDLHTEDVFYQVTSAIATMHDRIVVICQSTLSLPDSESCSLLDPTCGKSIATAYLSLAAIVTHRSLAFSSHHRAHPASSLPVISFLCEAAESLGAAALMDCLTDDDEALVLFVLHLHLAELHSNSRPTIRDSNSDLAALLDQLFSVGSYLNASDLFVLVVGKVFVWDVSVAVDFLSQPETSMLEYFLRLVKHLTRTRSLRDIYLDSSTPDARRIDGQRLNRAVVWKGQLTDDDCGEMVSPSEYLERASGSTGWSITKGISSSLLTRRRVLGFLDELAVSLGRFERARALPFSAEVLRLKIDQLLESYRAT